MHCQPVVLTCLLLFLPLLITSKRSNLNVGGSLTAEQILQLHAAKHKPPAITIEKSSMGTNSNHSTNHQHQAQSQDSDKSIVQQQQLESIPKLEQSHHRRAKEGRQKQGDHQSLLARRKKKHGHNHHLHLKAKQVKAGKEYSHLLGMYLNLRGRPLTESQYQRLVHLEMTRDKWQVRKVQPDPKFELVKSNEHWKDQLKQLKDKYDRQWRPERRKELAQEVSDTEQQVLASKFFSMDSKERHASDQLARRLWKHNLYLSDLYFSGLNQQEYTDAKRHYKQYDIKVQLPQKQSHQEEEEEDTSDNDNDPKNFPFGQGEDLFAYYQLLQSHVRSQLSTGKCCKQVTAAEWDRLRHLRRANHQFIDNKNRHRLTKKDNWLQRLQTMKDDLQHQLHKIDEQAQEREEKGEDIDYQLAQYELAMNRESAVVREMAKTNKILSYLRMEKGLPQRLKDKHGYMRRTQTAV